MQDDGGLDQEVRVEQSASRYAPGVGPLGFWGGLDERRWTDCMLDASQRAPGWATGPVSIC